MVWRIDTEAQRLRERKTTKTWITAISLNPASDREQEKTGLI